MNDRGAGKGGTTSPPPRLAAVLLLAWIGAGCGGDTPHDLLTSRMTAVNATSYDAHAAR